MVIADLHIHSKYSRATSRDCVPEMLELWARRKGIGLVGTGDFTHPAWREELGEKLIPAEEGLWRLKPELRQKGEGAWDGGEARFVISGEISCIYKQDGRVRKVHNLILLPGLEAAEALSRRLTAIGNLHSDGRPILGLSSRDLCEITFDCCPQAVFIPAHIWTPHFSLFGAFSGFGTVEECFGDMSGQIHAMETGLSSDPPMNWRLSALDRYALVSNSDAHSPSRLGREANLINGELSYPALAKALDGRGAPGLAGTIEFYPEEGKYHFDGHRSCGVCLSPQEFTADGRCPSCGRKLTIGVLHRVEELADRAEGYLPPSPVPFQSLVPLEEVLSACLGCAPGSARAGRACSALLSQLGPEFTVLRETPVEEIAAIAGPVAAEGVRRMRTGEVALSPGYDGEYGRIGLFSPEELAELSGQLSLFGRAPKAKKPAGAHSRGKSLPPLPVREPEAPAKKREKPEKPAEDPLFGLNSQQLAAATARERAVAVQAGPGTGKTRTLIAHLGYLLRECGVPPQQVTAVTFTNRAAAELRERLEGMLGKREADKVQVGTFHALCLRQLAAGQAAPTVIDESEAQAIAAGVLAEQGLKLRPTQLLAAVSRMKSALPQQEAAAGQKEEAIPDAQEGSAPSPAKGTEGAALRAAAAAYAARLEQLDALDYDGLLLRALAGMENGEADGRAAFSYLLVDEFQDISPVQYRLIEAWNRGGEQLFVIGDPDQAIYGFRGSDAHCFRRLAAGYPGLRQVRLTENYRSAPAILRCALPVINKNGGEARVLSPHHPEGAPAVLCSARDEMQEAIAIAHEIGRMVGGIDMLASGDGGRREGVRGFSDIAVIYRTHRQAEALETALAHEGIPYVAAGRDRLLREKSVRGLLGFLRLLLDRQERYSLFAALQLLFSCPPPLLEPFYGWWLQNGADCLLPPEFAGNDGLLRFLHLYALYQPRTGEEPVRLIEALAADCGLSGELPILRLMHMAVLCKKLPEFLQTLRLGAEGDILRSSGRAYTADTVSLLTMHAAKGLEYPVVFLCGAKKGMLPLSQPGRHADPEEERRLFYVGLTRAQQELIISYAGEPSEFLAGLPAGELQRRQAGSAGQQAAKQMSLF